MTGDNWVPQYGHVYLTFLAQVEQKNASRVLEHLGQAYVTLFLPLPAPPVRSSRVLHILHLTVTQPRCPIALVPLTIPTVTTAHLVTSLEALEYLSLTLRGIKGLKPSEEKRVD